MTSTVPAVRPAKARLWRPLGEAVTEALQVVELRHQFPELAGLATGIAALDKHLRSILMPGMLVVVAAETGGGKSAFINQLAERFGQQDSVLSLILENTGIDSAMRVLANVSRTDLGHIRSGWAGQAGIPKALYDAAAHAKTLGVDIIEQVPLTVEDICQVAIDWKEDRNVDRGVLIVDQLSHIMPSDHGWWDRLAAAGKSTAIPRPPRPGANETVWLKWQTHVLKLLAERANLLVILVHQLNEAHGDGKPGLGSMSGSRGINQEADLILMPWRPKVAPEDAGPLGPSMGSAPTAKIREEDGTAWILCPKSRHGVEFEAEVRWVGAQQRFADPDEDVKAKHRRAEPASPRAKEGAARLSALYKSFDKDKKERLEAGAATLAAASAPARAELPAAPSTPRPLPATAPSAADGSAAACDDILWDFDTMPVTAPVEAVVEAVVAVVVEDGELSGEVVAVAPTAPAAVAEESGEAVEGAVEEGVDPFAGLPPVTVLSDEEYAKVTAAEDAARVEREQRRAAERVAAANNASAAQAGGFGGVAASPAGGFGGGGRNVVKPDIMDIF